jgi:Type IV secretion system proteins
MTPAGVIRRGKQRTGLAGAIICALIVLWTGAAIAVVPVTDVVTEANTLQSTINEVTAAAKRIEIINNQIAQLVQLRNTLAAISHGNLAAITQLAPELGGLGLTLPLGTDTLGLGKALSGTAGDLGATALLTQNLLNSSQWYAPQAPDFQSMFINQSALSAASAMAAGQTALQSNTQRLQSLNTLRNGLNSTPDMKASADATARLTGEQATAQAQTNQLLAMMMIMMAQKATTDSQQAQITRCAADTMLADARAAAAASAAGQVVMISTAPNLRCMPSPAATTAVAASPGVAQTTALATPNTMGTLFTGSTTPVNTDNSPLSTMLATSWGQTAASNAAALGVNPTALAATCVLESNCTANPGGAGTISGAFQMSNGTYLQTVSEVTGSNPALAAQITSKNDPASQSIAASQYLLDGAQSLQTDGVANPTVLDVRGYYQFGPQNGISLASAASNQLMVSTLQGLSPAALAANNITSSTTVAQWQASVTSKLGTSAMQPVLLTRSQ